MTFSLLTDPLQEHEVGAKAFHLSRLLLAGIPVPFGFVIGKSFYSSRDSLLQTESLKNDLAQYLKKISSPFVMVRSSAIGEDSAEHSFAGQLDSFVSENSLEEILKCISRCWNSLENNRLKHYGEQSGHSLISMGVIVQEMIEPEFSGVLFTHSPVNFDEGYIEWVKGASQKFISGEVTPNSLSFKAGFELEKMPFNLSELVKVASEVLKLSGTPQDIEWVEQRNKIYIVQARPITIVKHKQNWSNTNVNENYPDKLSPFLASLARESYYHYFKNLAQNLDVYPENSREIEYALSNAIGVWGQRMYYNMSHIHAILALTPFDQLFKNSFDDFVGYPKKTTPSQKWVSWYEKMTFSMTLMKHFFLLEKRVREIERTVDFYFEFCEKAQDIKDLSKAYHDFLHIRFNEWNKASFSDLFAMVTHGLLGEIIKRTYPEKAQGIQNELLSAIPNLISNTPIFEMYKIHKKILSHDSHQALFFQKPEVIWETLNQDRSSELYKLISNYLREWGFRSSGELTFLTPNYCDEPTKFIEMMQIYHLSNPEDPKIQFDKKHAQQKLLLKQALSANFSTALILKPLVKMTTFSISCRERVRLKQAKLYYGAKMTLLRFGKILQKKKLVDRPQDIFFFEHSEITALFSGEDTDFSYYQDLLKLRKASSDRAQQKPNNFLSLLGDFTNHTIIPRAKVSEGVLKGMPACGGEVVGVVRILENILDISRLKKGEILVTRQTDPGWICAFPLISGLIIERGGMLSHGSIVAREFGIPAIVGVESITTILKDGQRIHLDAYTGLITCLD